MRADSGSSFGIVSNTPRMIKTLTARERLVGQDQAPSGVDQAEIVLFWIW